MLRVVIVCDRTGCNLIRLTNSPKLLLSLSSKKLILTIVIIGAGLERRTDTVELSAEVFRFDKP